jgi:MinD superfamily P-loop ATPase
MRVVVLSGKGGAGKTLVATNLAWALARRRKDVTYADADVEEPNGHLFLRPVVTATERHSVHVPALRNGSCSGCGACQEACAFNAILGIADGVRVFPELCHACGACLRACPESALIETDRETGTLRSGRAEAARFLDGALDVGEPRAVPLIQHVVERTPERELALIDSPPGTACAAVAAAEGADLAILVCEPTPFGRHDAERTLGMCRALGLETVAIINRADLGDEAVRRDLEAQAIPVLAEVPFDNEIARACAEGELAARRSPGFASVIDKLAQEVVERYEALS